MTRKDYRKIIAYNKETKIDDFRFFVHYCINASSSGFNPKLRLENKRYYYENGLDYRTQMRNYFYNFQMPIIHRFHCSINIKDNELPF